MNPRLVLASLVALLLSACAGAEGDRSVASPRHQTARFSHSAANADCFFSRQINNFEVLDERNLLVFAGRRRVYHVEITPPSPDLRYAYGIQFRPAGRICGYSGERLVLQNGSVSRFPLSITAVYRLDENLEAAVRAHFGQSPSAPALPEADAGELVTDLEEVAGDTGEEAPLGPADSSDTGQEN